MNFHKAFDGKEIVVNGGRADQYTVPFCDRMFRLTMAWGEEIICKVQIVTPEYIIIHSPGRRLEKINPELIGKLWEVTGDPQYSFESPLETIARNVKESSRAHSLGG